MVDKWMVGRDGLSFVLADRDAGVEGGEEGPV